LAGVPPQTLLRSLMPFLHPRTGFKGPNRRGKRREEGGDGKEIGKGRAIVCNKKIFKGLLVLCQLKVELN